ncbi:MAG: hypothetical protein JWL63_3178 [Rhodocyclales bacterium]|nr:hypothetical protein [Rhodocyclales bacterium]
MAARAHTSTSLRYVQCERVRKVRSPLSMTKQPDTRQACDERTEDNGAYVAITLIQSPVGTQMNPVVVMKGVEFGVRYALQEAQLADVGRRMQSRLAFYSPAKVKGQLVFFIEQDGEVIALCNCEASNCGEVLTLIGMSVDPAHQGHGHCSTLVSEIARFMRDGGYRALCVTRYTAAGLKRLRPCLLRHMYDIEVLGDCVPLAA